MKDYFKSQNLINKIKIKILSKAIKKINMKKYSAIWIKIKAKELYKKIHLKLLKIKLKKTQKTQIKINKKILENKSQILLREKTTKIINKI